MHLCVEGFWQFSEQCSGDCDNGACVLCRAGDTQCVGATPRTCAPEGVWVAAAGCEGELPVCVPETASCICQEGASVCVGAEQERRCTEGAIVPAVCDADSLCEVDRCRVQAWTRQFGSSGSSDFAHSVSIDPNGNVLVAGITFGQLPEQTHSGGQDSFVRKYDPRGTELWTNQFGIVDDDGFSIFVITHAVAADASGNVFVAGQVGGGGRLPNQASGTVGGAFVRKYGPGSNQLWTRQFIVGEQSFPEARAVRTDASGNVIVAGNQSTSGGIFINKYTTEGQDVWAVVADTGYLQGHSLGVDGSGNVIVAGPYVRKYSSDGDALWSIEAAGFGGSAMSVDADGAGNLFVAGTSGQSVILRKYDPAGNELWTSDVGGGGPHAVRVDGAGNVFVSGNISSGELPGQSSQGDGDAFVKRFDPEGNERFVYQFGSSAFDRVFSVHADAKGSILLAGQTSGALSADSIQGGGDAFVLKLVE